MKIGIVLTWAPPRTGKYMSGLVSSMVYWKKDFKKQNVDVDLLYYNHDNQKVDKQWHKDFTILPPDKASAINNYDFIIFNPAGSIYDTKDKTPDWMPMITKIKKPFGITIQNEDELRQCIYKDLFMKHKLCKFVLPIAEGFTDWMFPTSHYDYEFMKTKSFMINPPYRTKINMNVLMGNLFMKVSIPPLIATTCRLTTRKRVVELLKISKEFKNNGIGIKVFGTEINWPYMKAMDEVGNKDCWSYEGNFDFKNIGEILKNVNFHYNFVYLKNKVFIPRLEIATVEALQQGCMPILCRESTPEWVTNNMAIVVGKDEMERLPGIVAVYAYNSDRRNNAIRIFAEAFNDEWNKTTSALIKRIQKIIDGNVP